MLPQLVGLKCVTCGEPVWSITEGAFCEQCGNPAHKTCMRIGETSLQDGKCACCGGDPAQEIAVEVRQERQKAEVRQERRQAEVRLELQQTEMPQEAETGAPPAPPAVAEGSPTSEFAFAQALVWALRIAAGLCVIAMIYQLNAMSNAAEAIEKEAKAAGRPEVRAEPSGQVLVVAIAWLAAAVVILALAEILKLVVLMVQSPGPTTHDEEEKDAAEDEKESAEEKESPVSTP
jgi:hypothetical protein